MDSRPKQFHEDSGRFRLYHHLVWMPAEILEAAVEFLPPAGQPLTVSRHYRESRDERKLPETLYMPKEYTVIDVTVTRDSEVVYRVAIRFRMTRKSDFVMVLEGDWEVVTGYWQNPKDWHHDTLDRDKYEQQP